MNRHLVLSCNLYSVSKQEEMSYSKNPSSKICAEGNDSSIFVSDISNLSRCLLSLRFEEMKLIPYWIYVQLSYNRSIDIFLSYIIQNFSWISLDVELRASFVPVCIIILVGFFYIIGMIWWVKSPTVEPGKRLTLTRSPCPHKFSTTIPFSIESPTMAVVPISQIVFCWFICFTSITANTLFIFFILLFLFPFKLIKLFIYWCICCAIITFSIAVSA